MEEKSYRRLARIHHQLQPSSTSSSPLESAPTLGIGLPALDIAFPQATPASNFPASVFDYFKLDELLSPEDVALGDRKQSVMENHVAPVTTKYWEKAEFPREVIPHLASLMVAGGTTKPCWGARNKNMCIFQAFLASMLLAVGFIVKKDTPGYKATKIENKIGLRMMQNGDIVMKDVFVSDRNRLPGINSFQDTNKVLAISWIMVAWQPIGIAMGVYDICHRYLQERIQFGAPLAAFQINQEKLVRMCKYRQCS